MTTEESSAERVEICLYKGVRPLLRGNLQLIFGTWARMKLKCEQLLGLG